MRGFRRWVRRQSGEHGHTAQIGRGMARTVRWVQGSEGARLAAAKHELDVVHRQYKAAKWDHSKRLVPGSEKERRRRSMETAFQESEALYGKLKKARAEARTRRLWRAAAALSPVATVEGAGFGLAGMPGGLLATTATLATFALLGRRTSAGEQCEGGELSLIHI